MGVLATRSAFSSAEQRMSSSGELLACHSHSRNQSTPTLPKMWNTLGHVSHCINTGWVKGSDNKQAQVHEAQVKKEHLLSR